MKGRSIGSVFGNSGYPAKGGPTLEALAPGYIPEYGAVQTTRAIGAHQVLVETAVQNAQQIALITFAGEVPKSPLPPPRATKLAPGKGAS